MRREDDHVLERASEMEVEGVRLRGKPQKYLEALCGGTDERQISEILVFLSMMLPLL